MLSTRIEQEKRDDLRHAERKQLARQIARYGKAL
jgi:hypothetical protein